MRDGFEAGAQHVQSVDETRLEPPRFEGAGLKDS
jgi:hypothetical protein